MTDYCNNNSPTLFLTHAGVVISALPHLIHPSLRLFHLASSKHPSIFHQRSVSQTHLHLPLFKLFSKVSPSATPGRLGKAAESTPCLAQITSTTRPRSTAPYRVASLKIPTIKTLPAELARPSGHRRKAQAACSGRWVNKEGLLNSYDSFSPRGSHSPLQTDTFPIPVLCTSNLRCIPEPKVSVPKQPTSPIIDLDNWQATNVRPSHMACGHRPYQSA